VAGNVKLRWTSQSPLSAIHAAHAVATGATCNDRKTEQALASPVAEINSRLLSASLDIAAFWKRLHAETLFQVPPEQACAIALSAAGCSELQVDQTARVILNRLGDSRVAFDRRFPKLSEQLKLRGRPLRDQWETYGPGLLSNITQQIWNDSPPADWWPSRVEAILVQPMRGGDGGYDADAARIWIEAVLTDIDPSVPEVLRLAYLITQLAIDSHTRERSSDGTSTSLPWTIGLVPITLTAGKELELVRSPGLPIDTAMRLWNIGSAEIATTTQRWWDNHQSKATPLPVALKELSTHLSQIVGSAPKPADLGIDLTEFD
jgi:hypothetical protein